MTSINNNTAKRFGYLGACVFILASLGTAEAAVIAVPPSGPCEIQLEGSIEPGDAARLKAVLGALTKRQAVKFCLSSPGGDYIEALQMIERMLASRYEINTVITEGSECYSACALMFLAGHRNKKAPVPHRHLHVRSVLGFHGPYIKQDDAKYDPDLVSEAYREGVKSIGLLIALAKDSLFPESLLNIGLEKGPDEFFLIDSIDKAGRWKIGLIGYRQPVVLTEQMMFSACANNMEWLAPGFTYDLDLGPAPVVFKNRKYRRLFPDFGDEAAWTCVADAYDAPKDGPRIAIEWISAGDRPKPFSLDKRQTVGFAATPLWQTLPRETRLLDLPTQ